MHACIATKKADFAFETTGSSRTFAPFLLDCKNKGYEINLLYLWLESPELALERVATRVEDGGHDIPEHVVRRRYKKSLVNLFKLYIPIADEWFLYDNSEIWLQKVAEKEKNCDTIIHNQTVWNKCRRTGG